MDARDLVRYVLGGIFAVVVGSLLLGQLLGQPVLLGFVRTGSMAPTLQPGDGFIAIPPALAGPIESGDVITYNAKTLNGGGLVTHRVVEETPRGFITRGDANPFTDQASGEPPVSRSQIVAVALQIGGSVVVIPNLGLVVTGIQGIVGAIQQQLAIILGTRAVLGAQGLGYLLFGFGIAVYAISTLTDSERAPRTRSRRRRSGKIDSRVVIGALTLLVLGIVSGSMLVSSGAQSFEVVSSESDTPGIQVIHVGGSETMTYIVPSNGIMPTRVYLESGTPGVDIYPTKLTVPGGGRRNVSITLSVPPQTGTYTRTIIEHRYLALLPPSLMDRLYRIHHLLPILAIDLLVGIGFAGLASGLVGWTPLRIDSRHQVSTLTRLRRWLRR